MQRRYYNYANFLSDIKILAARLKQERFDCLVAVSRGGLTIAHFLATALDTRNIALIRAIGYVERQKLGAPRIENAPDLSGVKEALIVDDIIDGGETMQAVLKTLGDRYPNASFKTAVIFQKTPASIRANFFAQECEEWIDFFWDVDPTKV
ncbi:MAG: phosphoribosyltransferase [Helicobacteraceae bacterium]|nr:phosphoribosyltransferase [Helicobacteraceae bacterium]